MKKSMPVITGKRVFSDIAAQLTPPSFKLLSQAQVDGETWYVVKCSYDTAGWVRTQPQQQWYEHSQSVFDMHETLYTHMALKWN